MSKEDFTRRSQDIWKQSERAKIVKHADNLKMQGTFESKANEKWSPGERATSIRQKDNLHVEGNVDYTKRTLAVTGDRTSVVKHADNLKVRSARDLSLLNIKCYMLKRVYFSQVQKKHTYLRLKENRHLKLKTIFPSGPAN